MSLLEPVRGPKRGGDLKILVINPNSSQSMSNGMKPVIDSIELSPSTQISIYTAPPTSPPSIDNDSDIQQSSHAILNDTTLTKLLSDSQYHAVLVACYSVDPLIHELAHLHPQLASVTGIFESSITTALSLLQPGTDQKWGIVTTGKFWEQHLTNGVAEFLGYHSSSAAGGGGDGGIVVENAKFAGVHTTGLNAGDFHADPPIPQEEIERRLKLATHRALAGGKTRVVIMGCAGMAGLEGIIRSAAEEEYGKEYAYGQLHVLDAVRAGVMTIDAMIRHQRLLQRK